MKEKILLIMFLFSSTFAFSQTNKFFVGQKAYPCSEVYSVGISKECSRVSPLDNIDCIIARNGSGGYFIFKSIIPINGTVLLYLDNDTVIKLLDRKMNDEINGWNYSMYTLTPLEVTKLKRTNIKVIRYGNSTLNNIDAKCDVSVFEPSEGSRRTLTGEYVKDYEYSRVNFPDIIKELFI